MPQNQWTSLSGSDLVPCWYQIEDLGSSSEIEEGIKGGKCQCLCVCIYVKVCQYLYTREVVPAAVSEIGRGNVRVLFL